MGFRQPRDLLVYGGETDADALPYTAAPEGLVFRGRSGRIEAWLDDEPVGVCSAQTLTHIGMDDGYGVRERPPAGADPRTGEWAVIRRLVVDPTLRGRGIGTALLADQLRRLSARGVKRFLLHVPDDADDVAALALYAKFGRLVDRQQVLRLSF